jgi:hypothetical protein
MSVAATLAVGCGGLECDGQQCSDVPTGSKTGGIGSGNPGDNAGETGNPPSDPATTDETKDDVACTPSAAPGAVDEGCGIFVKAGSDGGEGSKARPFGTLSEAIEPAVKASKRIYVCTAPLMEKAEVKVPSGVRIYGGVDCEKEWAYVGSSTKSVLSAPSGMIPLRLVAGKDVTEVHDMHVIAEAASKPSGSSIAVLADGAKVSFVGAVIEARDAMPGADGQAFGAAAASGLDGNPGELACSGASVLGAEGPANKCADGDSVGGPGGNGSAAQGGPGGSGQPGDSTSLNGGEGEWGGMMCTPGQSGTSGAAGDSGKAAKESGFINAVDGYLGVAGTDGKAGKSGQGGGGGGGAKGGKGKDECNNKDLAGGASGGSGASGGCGGLGGKGGGFGGSSIGIVSLGAELTFKSTSIKTGHGGAGGKGGPGQEGGKGGVGGPGGAAPDGSLLHAACAGGSGGDGGKGGDGGVGSPGHSIGIAFRLKAPPKEGADIQLGAPADGGTAQGMVEFE